MTTRQELENEGRVMTAQKDGFEVWKRTGDRRAGIREIATGVFEVLDFHLPEDDALIEMYRLRRRVSILEALRP